MKIPVLAALALVTPLLVTGAGGVLAAGSGSSDSSSSGSGSGNSNYDKYFKKGEAAERKRNYEDAVKYYQQALKAKPKDADALNNLGFSLRSIGKEYMMEAAKAYEEALRVDAKHDEALEYQGELYLWMGELAKAHENLRKLKSMKSPEAATLEKEIEAVLTQAKKLL